MKNIFKDWNYKKHAKRGTVLYLTQYAIDMTIGYFVCKSSRMVVLSEMSCISATKKMDC